MQRHSPHASDIRNKHRGRPRPFYRSPRWKALAAALLVAQGGFLVRGLIYGGVESSWSVAATMGMAAVAISLPRRVPALLSFIIALVGAANALGDFIGFDDLPGWYDSLLHFAACFAVTSTIVLFLWHGAAARMSLARLLLLHLGVGLAVGIAWEIFEYAIIPIGLADTLTDIVFDLVGAAASACLSRSALRSQAER